jgi:hydroxyacylglutathione hydrolase
MKALVNRLKVLAVPLFKDNYSYIVLGSSPNKAVLIDPANPPVILDYLHRHLPTYSVTCLLYTHKHWDHAGGSEQLVKALEATKPLVVAGKEDGEAIKGSNFLVGEDGEIDVNGLAVKVYNVPCHTRGHVLYHFKAEGAKGDVPSF